jgi:hypothetical protein
MLHVQYIFISVLLLDPVRCVSRSVWDETVHQFNALSCIELTMYKWHILCEDIFTNETAKLLLHSSWRRKGQPGGSLYWLG